MKFLNKIFFIMIGCTRPIFSMFLIYILYLLLGSVIFVTLETGYEKSSRSKSIKNIELIKEMIDVLRLNYTDTEIYHTFLREHENASSGHQPSNLGWRQIFGDRIFFAFILISTVGYGNVTANSPLGQIACILYTMVGFPIHVITMRLLSFKFRGGLRKMFKLSQGFFPKLNWPLVVTGTLFFLFWLSIFVLIPAYCFMVSEDWDYIRGLYFSFVSLSTIGLGDYVAGSFLEYQSGLFTFVVIIMLLWMFLGIGFLATSLNLLSYVIGIFTLDKLDCKCRQRAEARRKMKPLLDLIREVNWQLVKCKPDNFHDWAEIEDFKTFLTDNPQDVTPQMLRRMFDIAIDLKEKAYDQLANLQRTEIPMTPIMQRATKDLPEVASTSSSKVAFSSGTAPTVLDHRSNENNETIAKRVQDDSITAGKGVSGSELIDKKESSESSKDAESEADVNPEGTVPRTEDLALDNAKDNGENKKTTNINKKDL